MNRKCVLFGITAILVLSMSAMSYADGLLSNASSFLNEKSNNEKTGYRFRGYDWGTPLEEIKNNETTSGMIDGISYEVRESEKVFVVLTNVAKIDLFACFYFDDNWCLKYGVYVPQVTYLKSDMDYYSEFETIDNALTTLYGEPERYADVIDADKISNMSRDEIISKITQENAVITNVWTAEDESVILADCFFYNGHVRGEFYYLQNYDQFTEVTEENTANNTEGL